MPLLLAIDDDPLILECYRLTFPEVEVAAATTAAEGLRLYEARRPDAVLLDVRLPDRSGLELLGQLQAVDARVPVVLVTGQGTAETAIEAMRQGAFDYLVKPINPDELAELVGRAFDQARLSRVPAVLAAEGGGGEGDVLVGRCPPMQAVYKAIGRVAPQDVTVLITGESGTGKELVARAIYHYSRRSAGRFLAINCAAIPEALLESELFGHEKGAFTGADRKRVGKFEQADGGTLFLDEIGDMTPLTQAKVLRVLQDGTFERVGGGEACQSDVRLIAATNRDLERMLKDGRFREDLYYRLNVYRIALPPLRERPGDIPLLVEHGLRRFNRELGKAVRSVSPEAMAALERHSWPGNVRELQAALKQALIHATGPVLMPEQLPASVRGVAEAPAAAFGEVRQRVQGLLRGGGANVHEQVMGEVEKVVLEEVVRHTGGNLSQAARVLGISRPTLRARLAAFGLYEGKEE